jgi:hypothetical protein
VLPLLIPTAALAPLLVFSARLPEPIATHWGSGGQPNGSTPQVFFLASIALMTIIPAVVLAYVARPRAPRRQDVAGAAAIASFVGALMAAISANIVWANLDQSNWAAATNVGLGGSLLFGMIAVSVAAVAWVVGRRLESDAPEAPRSPPSAGLEMGERALWTGSVRCRWMAWLAAGSFLGGAAIMATVRVAPGVLFAVVGFVLLSFTSLDVRIDRRGVHIAFGALGWPTMNVDLRRIEQATVTDVVPMQWGGWGYRGGLWLFGKAAIVLRGGEGLCLDLAGGKRLLVTLDGAEQAAGVVNDLLRGRQQPDSAA